MIIFEGIHTISAPHGLSQHPPPPLDFLGLIRGPQNLTLKRIYLPYLTAAAKKSLFFFLTWRVVTNKNSSVHLNLDIKSLHLILSSYFFSKMQKNYKWLFDSVIEEFGLNLYFNFLLYTQIFLKKLKYKIKTKQRT